MWRDLPEEKWFLLLKEEIPCNSHIKRNRRKKKVANIQIKIALWKQIKLQIQQIVDQISLKELKNRNESLMELRLIPWSGSLDTF